MDRPRVPEMARLNTTGDSWADMIASWHQQVEAVFQRKRREYLSGRSHGLLRGVAFVSPRVDEPA